MHTPVAQLDEHRAVMCKVARSNPSWISTQDFKITEEKVLPLQFANLPLQIVSFSSFQRKRTINCKGL